MMIESHRAPAHSTRSGVEDYEGTQLALCWRRRNGNEEQFSHLSLLHCLIEKRLFIYTRMNVWSVEP